MHPHINKAVPLSSSRKVCMSASVAVREFLSRLWQIIPKEVPIMLFSYSQNFYLFSQNQPIIPKYFQETAHESVNRKRNNLLIV